MLYTCRTFPTCVVQYCHDTNNITRIVGNMVYMYCYLIHDNLSSHTRCNFILCKQIKTHQNVYIFNNSFTTTSYKKM